jgi:predicted esterase
MPDSAPVEFTHRFLPATDGGTTLLLLHGTGGNEDDLLPLGPALLPGAAILSPRGRVLENGMPRFFRRVSEGVLDVSDLKRRAEELAQFVETALERYRLDPGRVVAVGFSNGANVAGGLLLGRPRLLRAAILFRPMVPYEPERSPDLRGVDVFVSAGRSDPLTPVSNVERLAGILRVAGARVDLAWDPEGHALPPAAVDAARVWLARSVAARPAETERREP